MSADMPAIFSASPVEERLMAACGPDARRVAGLWRMDKCLVVPRKDMRHDRFRLAARASRRRGWPIAIRATGGSAVPNGPGVLNLTIVTYSSSPDLDASYDLLCAVIVRALARQGVPATVGPVEGAFCDGRYNVAIDGRKVAGTAQRWIPHRSGRYTVILAHAAIAIALDPAEATAAVQRYYQDLASHMRFDHRAATNIVEAGACPDRFERSLRDVIGELGMDHEAGGLHEHA